MTGARRGLWGRLMREVRHTHDDYDAGICGSWVADRRRDAEGKFAASIVSRQHRLLMIDLLTVLFITPVIGAYVYLSVRGIVELSKGPVGVDPNETATEGLTAIGLMVLCFIILMCYVIWICVTFSGLFYEWHGWWSTCYRIKVLEGPPEGGQRQPAGEGSEEPGAAGHRESSLELIFSRGVFSRRHTTV